MKGITSEKGNDLLKEKEYPKWDTDKKRKWTQNSLQGSKEKERKRKKKRRVRVPEAEERKWD